MRSLRARLFVVWLLSLAAACAVGLLLVQLYRQSTSAQTERAEAALAQACDSIVDRYGYYASGWTPRAGAVQDAPLRRDLATVVSLALSDSDGIAGGIYDPDAGALAYVGGKADLSAAERARVTEINRSANSNDQPESARATSGGQTLLLQACPLRGPLPGLTAWTMTRVTEADGWDALRAGLGVLLALVLALSGGLTWLVLAWTRHIGRIETALAGAGAADLPRLPPTGEAELDRIVAALNTAGARLSEARRNAADLSARVADAERLAALGRVAAGVAHEFRNPIAAMRLKAENALAEPARGPAALRAVLEQVARLDRLIGELLAMTQRRAASPAPVDPGVVLRAVAADHPGVSVQLDLPPTLPLDAELLRRTLDPLLDNARRHGPPVLLRARWEGAVLRVTVADSGPGLAPDLRKNLFEPFVTGRADGTGLGLAIARELARAQGGTLVLAEPGGAAADRGAVFRLEIPCPPS